MEHKIDMAALIERRQLQVMVAIACLIPLLVGGGVILHGPGGIGHLHTVPVDLDSHVRYLSGIFFALGLGFASCVPAIERKGARFRLLGALVIAGGLARLISLFAVGEPSSGHMLGLAMELGIMPCLLLWQARVARSA